MNKLIAPCAACGAPIGLAGKLHRQEPHRVRAFTCLLVAAVCLPWSGASAADHERLPILVFELAPGATLDRTCFHARPCASAISAR